MASKNGTAHLFWKEFSLNNRSGQMCSELDTVTPATREGVVDDRSDPGEDAGSRLSTDRTTTGSKRSRFRSAEPGEALIRVEAVGICASDLKCYHGAAKFWGDENRPAWTETMVIPGHEFVGRVVELDDEAAEQVGHRRR